MAGKRVELDPRAEPAAPKRARRTAQAERAREAERADDAYDDDAYEDYDAWFRDAELAAKGLLAWAFAPPDRWWDALREAGVDWERRRSRRSGEFRRVRYPEER